MWLIMSGEGKVVSPHKSNRQAVTISHIIIIAKFVILKTPKK